MCKCGDCSDVLTIAEQDYDRVWAMLAARRDGIRIATYKLANLRAEMYRAGHADYALQVNQIIAGLDNC